LKVLTNKPDQLSPFSRPASAANASNKNAIRRQKLQAIDDSAGWHYQISQWAAAAGFPMIKETCSDQTDDVRLA
jgi:hypothetical protein